MTIDDVYKLMLYIVAKNKQQGYLSPADFNIVINQAQKSYVDYLLGSFQQYRYDKPEARVEFGQNEIIRQRLTPFINTYNIVVDSNGNAPYPQYFIQVDSMKSAMTFAYSPVARIRAVQENYLDSYHNSVIDPIASNPIYLLQKNQFQFYPVTIATAKLSYIKEPNTMVWGYTLDGNSRPVYDASTSVSPQWYDVDLFQIIVRALELVGVSMQSADVFKFSQSVKAGGQ